MNLPQSESPKPCMASEVLPEPISTSLTESTSDEASSVIHVSDKDASHILQSHNKLLSNFVSLCFRIQYVCLGTKLGLMFW